MQLNELKAYPPHHKQSPEGSGTCIVLAQEISTLHHEEGVSPIHIHLTTNSRRRAAARASCWRSRKVRMPLNMCEAGVSPGWTRAVTTNTCRAHTRVVSGLGIALHVVVSIAQTPAGHSRVCSCWGIALHVVLSIAHGSHTLCTLRMAHASIAHGSHTLFTFTRGIQASAYSRKDAILRVLLAGR